MAAYRIVKLNDSWKGENAAVSVLDRLVFGYSNHNGTGGKPDRIPEKDV